MGTEVRGREVDEPSEAAIVGGERRSIPTRSKRRFTQYEKPTPVTGEKD